MLRLTFLPYLIAPMIEMVHLGDGKEMIIVNETCGVVVETADVLTNYPKVEKMVLEKCDNEN